MHLRQRAFFCPIKIPHVALYRLEGNDRRDFESQTDGQVQITPMTGPLQNADASFGKGMDVHVLQPVWLFYQMKNLNVTIGKESYGTSRYFMSEPAGKRNIFILTLAVRNVYLSAWMQVN
ncbi:hypothetical protein AVEN_53468-1 [Araneus ventricosus]|uniref:Uncharacterized protein n=1 Tax=Araneus ventricosus TaxID=182803 RepID=A0A4Y2ACX3_ARAVE|nr:hypothetical protein AVEN_53468-1 [Araneus ventricosus]